MALNSQIGALRVHLGLNSAQFSQGLKQAQTKMQRFQLKMGGIFKTLAVVATAAFAAATAAVLKFSQKADETIKTARALGMTAEQLSRLQLAARRGGVEIKTLNTSLRTFNTNISDAAAGMSSRGAQAFERLGISVRNLDGSLKSNRDLLGEVADKFQAMPDGVEKSARAMELFGSRGASMINILNQGRDGLAAMDREADNLGQTINSKTAAAAEVFNDNLARMTERMQGAVNEIVSYLLPALARMTNRLLGINDVSLSGLRLELEDTRDHIAEIQSSILDTDLKMEKLRLRGRQDTALSEKLRDDRRRLNEMLDIAIKKRERLTGQVEKQAKLEETINKRVDARLGKPVGRTQAQATATTATSGSGQFRDLPDDVRRFKDRLTEANRESDQLVSTLSSGLESAFTNAIKGTGDLKRELLDLAVRVIGGELKRHLLDVLGLGGRSGGGGGGFLGSLFGGGGGGGFAGPLASLGALFGTSTGSFGGASALFSGASAASSLGVLGFRTGGEFSVPGHGGPDSELAAFRVSPGESVSIDRNGGGGGGPSHITVDVRGAQGDRAIEERVQAGVAAGLQQYDNRLPARLRDIDRRQF